MMDASSAPPHVLQSRQGSVLSALVESMPVGKLTSLRGRGCGFGDGITRFLLEMSSALALVTAYGGYTTTACRLPHVCTCVGAILHRLRGACSGFLSQDSTLEPLGFASRGRDVGTFDEKGIERTGGSHDH